MNNYNQNYPNQQPGYNTQPQPHGNPSGYPMNPPPIGFNCGNEMNQNPYPVGGPQPPVNHSGHNQYPPNPQPSMAPSYGYQMPQQSYATQSQYTPVAQNQQNYGQPVNNQGYGNAYPQMQGQHVPHNITPMAPVNNQGYGNAYPQMQGQHVPHNITPIAPVNIQGYDNVYPKVGVQNTVNPITVNPTAPSFGISTNNQMNIDCIGSAGESYRGTIKPHPNFNSEQDCNALRTAMKRSGTDEKAIIECLGRRNLSQRLDIKKTFKTMFGKDLIDELKSELSGNFSRAVVESLYDSDYYDAYSLFKAMEGAGTREDVLTEILTSRSNQQIENIKVIFQKFFNKNLEKEVKSETSGFYKRVLVSCLQANKKELTTDEISRLRQQGPIAVVNVNLARQEAQELYNAGEKKLGTDEACFIKIFASRNKYQLRATFEEYKKIANRDILSSIEREMSGDLASSLKAIAMQAINPALYFATRLYKSMKGLGTNDTALIRILLTRSEIDLENIKTEFQKQYSKTLDSFVRGDTSGDYLKFLTRFVEGN